VLGVNLGRIGFLIQVTFEEFFIVFRTIKNMGPAGIEPATKRIIAEFKLGYILLTNH
jgi:NAD kinase